MGERERERGRKINGVASGRKEKKRGTGFSSGLLRVQSTLDLGHTKWKDFQPIKFSWTTKDHGEKPSKVAKKFCCFFFHYTCRGLTVPVDPPPISLTAFLPSCCPLSSAPTHLLPKRKKGGLRPEKGALEVRLLLSTSSSFVGWGGEGINAL